jgi:uncharacterized protein YecE (DUF72 family)
MSYALTTIFGAAIKVSIQPRQPDRQKTGYAGAHGATSMLMGSSGYPLIVTGTLRANGATYAAARAAMIQLIETIESYAWAPEQIYTYGNEAYYYMVFKRLQLIDDNSKMFHYTGSYCFVKFIAYFESLL